MEIKVNEIYVYDTKESYYLGRFEFSRLGLKLAYTRARNKYIENGNKITIFGINEKCELIHLNHILNKFKFTTSELNRIFLTNLYNPNEDFFYEELEYLKRYFPEIGNQIEKIYKEYIKYLD